ncbi:efflux RND transporter periplasmic adaptor subunit [Collimonas silvisoli]|uniref:efflux RND transporter periplasmic adaptor subunit n=1 Tax=Collimonas silvisoli TaxID=2825884 RepID=UPI002E778C7B|nr:efflux RND transporter periplasmic adaptor subunit [Collimonas silvisoli]
MSVVRRHKLLLVAMAVILAAILWRIFLSPSTAASMSSTPPPVLTVNVTNPTRENWSEVIQADGILTAWQEAVIGAETGSVRITELLADVGSTVKRGQVLARLASASANSDVRKQKAAVAQARANLEQAQADVKRSKAAADSGALSVQKIDEYRIAEESDRALLDSAEADLQSKQIVLAQTNVLAVDDGVISSRSALLGNVVSVGTELFRIVRQGKVEWQAEVTAQQLARVQEGQEVSVTLPGGKAIHGQVRLVAPTLSANTGRAIVYVSLPANSGAQVGMFASGSIKLSKKWAVALPESALVLRDGRSDVYVLGPDGNTVSRRTVVTGRREQGLVEIVSGLDTGAHVVASGGAFLSDGASVKVVNAGRMNRDAT